MMGAHGAGAGGLGAKLPRLFRRAYLSEIGDTGGEELETALWNSPWAASCASLWRRLSPCQGCDQPVCLLPKRL